MQKRSVIKIAIAVLILFCGLVLLFRACPRKSTDPAEILARHTGTYTTTAKITYKELSARALISQETPASCSVVFESPPSLQDMAFLFRRDNVDVNYKGLSFTFEHDSLPAAAVAKLAVSAINRAMRDDGLEVTIEDGTLAVKGLLESGEFVLQVNSETGSLLKLLIPAEKLEIEFENFTFLD